MMTVEELKRKNQEAAEVAPEDTGGESQVDETSEGDEDEEDVDEEEDEESDEELDAEEDSLDDEDEDED